MNGICEMCGSEAECPSCGIVRSDFFIRTRAKKIVRIATRFKATGKDRTRTFSNPIDAKVWCCCQCGLIIATAIDGEDIASALEREYNLFVHYESFICFDCSTPVKESEINLENLIEMKQWGDHPLFVQDYPDCCEILEDDDGDPGQDGLYVMESYRRFLSSTDWALIDEQIREYEEQQAKELQQEMSK